MEMKIYDIHPNTKPRMTRKDKWAKRPCVVQYRQFKDDMREANVNLPDSGYHLIFVLSMPLSWKKVKGIKAAKMRHTACQKVPDKDNLEKAVMDALFTDDSHIWNGTATKVWGDSGKIILITGIDTDWIKVLLDEVLL